MKGSQRSLQILGLNYPPEATGIAPYTGALAAGLHGRGFAAHVMTAHPHYPAWKISPGYGRWSSRERIDGVDVRRMLHYVPSNPSSVRRAISEISFGVRLVARRWNEPGAIIAVSPALLSTAMVAARARLAHRSTPVVVWVQDIYSLGLLETGQGSGAVARMMKRIEGWTLRNADRVVVIHPRFAERVIADFGIPRERVEVVRNWTHIPPIPDVDRADLRARFGWPVDTTVVLHAGNMGVKQGLDYVVEAARRADETQSDVRFVLLGAGGEARHLKDQADGVERIQFMASLPDDQFTSALAAADILLVNEKPGVSEMAVPSKLTSYFNAGRPVLAATDPDGITAEEIHAADAGVVVEAGYPGALLSAVLELADQPGEMQRFGQNGLRYRHTVLDEQHAIDRFVEVLDSLVPGEMNAAQADATTEWSTP